MSLPSITPTPPNEFFTVLSPLSSSSRTLLSKPHTLPSSPCSLKQTQSLKQPLYTFRQTSHFPKQPTHPAQTHIFSQTKLHTLPSKPCTHLKHQATLVLCRSLLLHSAILSLLTKPATPKYLMFQPAHFPSPNWLVRNIRYSKPYETQKPHSKTPLLCNNSYSKAYTSPPKTHYSETSDIPNRTESKNKTYEPASFQ